MISGYFWVDVIIKVVLALGIMIVLALLAIYKGEQDQRQRRLLCGQQAAEMEQQTATRSGIVGTAKGRGDPRFGVVVLEQDHYRSG